MNEEIIKSFLNATMAQCGGIPNGMLSAVLSVWLAPDNKYAFVEMCTTDCAAVALGLNGIPFMDVALRIARPKTYSEGPTGVTNSMMALPGLIPGVL